MALEIEGKFRVASHDAVRKRLESLGARRLGAAKEVNHIFDNADRSLLAADCGLRVRDFEEVAGEPKEATLTYKGPRQRSAIKIREEIETTVGNAAGACRMLAVLGFVEVLVFEKRRESWRWGACEIELDELPYLGCYVEIEGPSEEAVGQVQRELELQAAEAIRSSYIALLIDYCREYQRSTARITFGGQTREDS